MDIGTDRRSVGIKLITIKIFPNDSAVLPGGPEDSRPNGLSALCICLVSRPDSTLPGRDGKTGVQWKTQWWSVDGFLMNN